LIAKRMEDGTARRPVRHDGAGPGGEIRGDATEAARRELLGRPRAQAESSAGTCGKIRGSARRPRRLGPDPAGISGTASSPRLRA
jgi:hypothetical protein